MRAERSIRAVALMVTMAMATIFASNARARDEYVNPVFCYRLVLPDGVSRVSPGTGDSGIDMVSDATCGGVACLRIDVEAGYAWDRSHQLRRHDDYLAEGWKLDSAAKERSGDTLWDRYVLSRDDMRLRVYEKAGKSDQANYVVTARYRKDSSRIALRSLGQLLASWRWLSACL